MSVSLRKRIKAAHRYDYANANTSPKQLILTGSWALIVFGLGIKIALFGW